MNKTKITDNEDPIGDCCFRLVLYECTKQLLTAKCAISKDLVEIFDDLHCKFWNYYEENQMEGNYTDEKQHSLEVFK